MRQSIVAAALILCFSAPRLEAEDDKPLVLERPVIHTDNDSPS